MCYRDYTYINLLNMKKSKKKLKIDKGLIILIILFIALFFLKSLLYNLLGNNFYILLEGIFKYIPENILFYLFLPIYYIFMFPMIWILEKFTFLNQINNQFILFSLDILLTIIYLTLLFFLFKKIKKTFFK